MLGAILLITSFLRLHKISEYMTFLGDEGRDVLVAKGILEGDIVLLGPRSSAADFFYGPIYYYMITPFLWLFNFDPVGPAVFVALIGIATVFLIYKVGKEFLGSSLGGLLVAALYAVSPLVIAYSRSSWNPNPLPFVSLLSLYILYKGIPSKSLLLFLIVGVFLGIGMQLQYLTLFLSVIIAVITFLGTWYILKKIDIQFLIKRYVAIFAGFLIGFSPFLAFEIKYGFPNTRTILRYIFTHELDPVDAESRSLSSFVIDVLFRSFARLVTHFPALEQINVTENSTVFFWYILTILLIILSLVFLARLKNKLALIVLTIWLVLGMGLFLLYKDKVFDYHFGFMFPLPFLLVGNVFMHLIENKKRALKIIGVGLFILLLFRNLGGHPFKYAPNRQKDQVKMISEFVLSKTEGKPFNFALITLGNSDHAYRYYFKLHNQNPVTIENEVKDPRRKTITDLLLIVCEDVSCKPLGNSLWEVAGFGQATISGEWNLSVVKVYKLTHYKENNH